MPLKRLREEAMLFTKGTIIIFLIGLLGRTQAEDVNHVQIILQNNSCISCHGEGSRTGDFKSLDTDEKWRNSGYITVGDGETSYFIQRIKNAGGNMPLGAAPLSSDDFNYLKSYITNLPANSGGGNDSGGRSDGEIDLGSDSNSIAGQLLIFNRCYSQFTRKILNENNTYITQIENKEITASDACMDLLAKANLKGSTGEVGSDLEGKEIIKTFNDFHATWFPSRDLEKNTDNELTNSIFDEVSPALYFTQNLFSEGVFKNIFSGTTSVKAQRLKDGNRVFYKADQSQIAQGNTIERIQEGEIVGVSAKKDYIFNRVRNISNGNIEEDPQSIFKGFGGGVLGDPANILMSAGAHIGRNSDGGRILMRTLSKNLFQQFFCRELPLVRPGDEVPFVHPSLSSRLPFRNGNSCMRCHSSIDPLARGFRKLRVNYTEGNNGLIGANLKIHYLHQFKTSMNAEDLTEWPEKDQDFHKRPANGRLFMRTIDGTLIDESFEGLEELGQVIMQLDDVYACTASRYYHFLTGIKVNLDDLDNPSAATLSAKEIEYRDHIIKLGRELKKHQSLKELIRQIINSKSFYRPGLGVE